MKEGDSQQKKKANVQRLRRMLRVSCTAPPSALRPAGSTSSTPRGCTASQWLQHLTVPRHRCAHFNRVHLD